MDFFGAGETPSINLSAMISSIVGANSQREAYPDYYTQQLNDVNTELRNISEKTVTTGDMVRAFAGMRVVLDSGEVVGALAPKIDEALGQIVWRIERNVSVEQ